MEANQSKLEDYSLKPVPDSDRKSTFNVTITSCAWIISLSTIFTGGALVAGLSFTDAILAAVFGMLLLALIGFSVGYMGAKYGVSTTMLARQAFGRYGANVFGILLALTMGVGWFGWQIAFFGMTMAEMLPGQWFAQPEVAMVWGGILMMLTALLGYRGLAAISMIAVPLIAILSVWGLAEVVNQLGSWGALWEYQPTGDPLTLFAGITIVAGNAASGAIVFADVTRYGKTGFKGGLGGSAGYFLGGVFCIIAGAAMAVAAQVPTIGSTPNIPAAMSQLGMGFFAFLILVFAQWTTNDNNLYTGSLGLRNVIRLPKAAIVFLLGGAGLIIALIGIQDYFVPFLNALGTYVPPIAGVMIADHWIVKKYILKQPYRFGEGTNYAKWNIAAIISAVLGGVVGANLPFGIAAVNSVIVAFLLYIIIAFILYKLNINFLVGKKAEEISGF